METSRTGGIASSGDFARPFPKLHLIQLLRAAAAMLVVLFHAQLSFSTRLAPPAFEGESYFFGFGAVGVHIFFVISGFIMVYTNPPTQSFRPGTFFRRRLLRIYPIYWLCCGLYLAAHVLIGKPYLLSASEIAGAFLLAPGHAAAIVGPAWTLAFEIYFYLCFGIAMTLGPDRGLIALAVGFGGSIVGGYLLGGEDPLWKLITNSLLIEFLAGAIIGRLTVADLLPRRGGRTLSCGAILLFAVGIAVGYDKGPSVLIWGIPSAILVLGMAMHERRKGSTIMIRKLGHFGDSSYALYLIHILVITLAIEFALAVPVVRQTEPAMAALPLALIALFLAEFLHHRIERPFLRRFNGAQKSEAATRPAGVPL